MIAMGGSYVTTVPIQTFLAKRDGDSGFLAAELRGARLVLADEPRPGGRYDDGYMKDITGRGRQRTAGKYEKPVEWVPQCTASLMSNDPVKYPTSDEAMLRRQEVIAFARGYQVADTGIDARLAAEANGVLALMVATLLWTARNGQPELPASMVAARELMADETEDALRFVRQRLEEGKLAHEPGVSAYKCAGVDWMYREFQDWCRGDEGVRWPLSRKDFSRVLGRRWKVIKSNGYRFSGLMVVTQDDGRMT
jgi:phage/plasmid-associated DNA primase